MCVVRPLSVVSMRLYPVLILTDENVVLDFSEPGENASSKRFES
jgi:hypothetical protein